MSAWEKVLVGAAVLAALAVLVAVLVALVWPVARHRLIYPGGGLAAELADPMLHGLTGAEEVWLEAEDGVRLHAWWTPAEGEPRGAVVYCHGNAESMATRAWIAGRLAHLGYHTLLFDYRGYGLSHGRASGGGLARDARAAWRHVVEDRGQDPGHVILMGHSLGSAVATRLTLELEAAAGSGEVPRAAAPGRANPERAEGGRDGPGAAEPGPASPVPAALVVGSPFPDMPALFRHHAPWLPDALLRWRRDRHDAGSRLAAVNAPVLAIIGTDDEVIPPEMSRQVTGAIEERPAPSTVVTVPADHATVMGHPAVWAAVGAFMDQVPGD